MIQLSPLIRTNIYLGGKKKKMYCIYVFKLPTNKNVLLSSPVKLLHRTQLVKKLLVDESRHLQELVVGDKLVHDLSLHPPGLQWQVKKLCKKCETPRKKKQKTQICAERQANCCSGHNMDAVS